MNTTREGAMMRPVKAVTVLQSFQEQDVCQRLLTGNIESELLIMINGTVVTHNHSIH